MGKTDVELDQSILDKVITIQKLPEEDKAILCIRLMGLYNMPRPDWLINNKRLAHLNQAFVLLSLSGD